MSEQYLRGRARLSDTDVQIESLRDRRKQVLLRANGRVVRAPIKAGLAELTIPDDALDAVFEEVAARFRKISVTSGGKSHVPLRKREQMIQRIGPPGSPQRFVST